MKEHREEIKEVGRLFSELSGITDVDLTTGNQCITTLTRVAASRVAETDHPEGGSSAKKRRKNSSRRSPRWAQANSVPSQRACAY